MARRGKRIDPHTEEILQKFNLDPKECLWDCHGTWILLHKWVVLIGQRAGVILDPPKIIETNAEKKTVVIQVSGQLGKGDDAPRAWTFGEAAPANNKNAYPFAMAEKRAKDRVILELVGLAGHVYTDQDIPDMNNGKPVWEIKQNERTATAVREDAAAFAAAMRKAQSRDELLNVAGRISENKELTSADKAELRNVFTEVEHNLGGQNG
tara:strand:+ start:3173 stop:3799 length:627 start_codon:yes stop_codon:yes gene_type:complete